MDGKNQPPYATIDVGTGLENPAVGRDMALDRTGQHIYTLTGDKVCP